MSHRQVELGRSKLGVLAANRLGKTNESSLGFRVQVVFIMNFRV